MSHQHFPSTLCWSGFLKCAGLHDNALGKSPKIHALNGVFLLNFITVLSLFHTWQRMQTTSPSITGQISKEWQNEPELLTTFSLPPTPQPPTPISQGSHSYFHTIHSLARNRVSTEMTHGIKPKLARANSVKAKKEALTLNPGKIGFKISLRRDSMVSQLLSSKAKTVTRDEKLPKAKF